MTISLRTLAIAGMLALGTSTLPSTARADDTPPTTPTAPAAGATTVAQAKTPTECIEGMAACAKKEDYQGMTGYMAEPFRSTMPKMYRGFKSDQGSNASLKKAVEEKFGPGSAGFIQDAPMKKILQGTIEIKEAKEDGDKATVKVHETKEGQPAQDQTYECVKVDGFWFANMVPAKDASADQVAKVFGAMGDALGKASTDTDALTADVAGGKVATKEEAAAKFQQIQMRMRMQVSQAMMGSGAMPPRGGQGGPKRDPGAGSGKPAEPPATGGGQ